MSWFTDIFRSKKPTPHSGATISRADLIARHGNAITGDECYARVSSAWLDTFYGDFRSVLFREGVAKWDDRFDCDDFAMLFVGIANLRFFSAAFHDATPAQSLALGEFWYRIDGGPNTHACVVAYTDKGRVFIEPQTGATLALTDAEIASAYLVKF